MSKQTIPAMFACTHVDFSTALPPLPRFVVRTVPRTGRPSQTLKKTRLFLWKLQSLEFKRSPRHRRMQILAAGARAVAVADATTR